VDVGKYVGKGTLIYPERQWISYASLISHDEFSEINFAFAFLRDFTVKVIVHRAQADRKITKPEARVGIRAASIAARKFRRELAWDSNGINQCGQSNQLRGLFPTIEATV